MEERGAGEGNELEEQNGETRSKRVGGGEKMRKRRRRRRR